MASNITGHSTHPHVRAVDSLCGGMNGSTHQCSGRSRCYTWKEEPLYEISMKERLKGKERMYSLSKDISLNLLEDESFSGVAGQFENLTDKLKKSKSKDYPAHDLGDTGITKPNIHDMELMIKKLEAYTALFKSKLEKCKEEEERCKPRETVIEKPTPCTPAVKSDTVLHTLQEEEEEGEGNEECSEVGQASEEDEELEPFRKEDSPDSDSSDDSEHLVFATCPDGHTAL